MKYRSTSLVWLAALSMGSFFACNGKLHVGKGTEAEGAAAGETGSNQTGVSGSAGMLAGTGGSSGRPAITKVGNTTACPTGKPEVGESCSIEGVGCGYRVDEFMTYDECICAEWAPGDARWSCNSIGTSYPSCPDSVENGSSCFGHYSTECWYPTAVRCSCYQGSGVWECTGSGRPWLVPDPPSSVRADAPITQLSDAELEAWCRWYQDAIQGPGFPPLPDAEVGPDGKTQTYNCQYGIGGPACAVAAAMLSVRQCTQNLALSACAAPIGALSDCVTTTLSQCLPSPHGCARYIQAPNCNGTIVVSSNGPPLPGTAGASATGGAGPAASLTAGSAGADGGPLPSGGGGVGSGASYSSPCSVQVQ
jgi:hypothetical protein